MVDSDNDMDEEYMGEKLVMILLGAISGVISLAILTEYIVTNEWLSPVFGLLAILLLAGGGLLGNDDNSSEYRNTR
ncbi:MAG: hypothetical protein R6V35_02445 [Candidatus Nanohaloarchaea archaeon]